MASAPALVLVFAILGGGLAILLIGTVGALQWLRLSVRSSNLDREGPKQLAGRAHSQAEDLVTAPVSNERALCYEWALERDAGRRARTDWRTVASGDDRVMLGIETETVTVRVDPTTAALALAVDETHPVESVEDLPDGLSSLATELNPETRYRVIERRLEPNDHVTATGVFVIGDDSPQLRRPAVPWLVERVLAVPYVIADEGRDDGVGLVRDRAIAGFVLGLPPTLLALVLLFPP